MSNLKTKILNGGDIIERFQKQISGLRTGRVNASVLENILVEAYGTKMHIVELATVNVPEPSQLLITPFDKGLISSIVKAIQESNLGVNPIDDGAGVRLNFPPLTEETRKQRVKDLYKILESSRVETRLKRQEAIKQKKSDKEAGSIGEDQLRDFENEIQKEVDLINSELEKIAKTKEDEIMKV